MKDKYSNDMSASKNIFRGNFIKPVIHLRIYCNYVQLQANKLQPTKLA